MNARFVKKSTPEEDKKLPAPVTFRVASEEERERLKIQADKAGLELSSYIRACCFENPPELRSRRTVPIEKKLLSQLLGQLGKAGGNIHQLVKYQNIHKEGVDREAYLSALSSFEEATAAILEALGREGTE